MQTRNKRNVKAILCVENSQTGKEEDWQDNLYKVFHKDSGKAMKL